MFFCHTCTYILSLSFFGGCYRIIFHTFAVRVACFEQKMVDPLARNSDCWLSIDPGPAGDPQPCANASWFAPPIICDGAIIAIFRDVNCAKPCTGSMKLGGLAQPPSPRQSGIRHLFSSKHQNTVLTMRASACMQWQSGKALHTSGTASSFFLCKMGHLLICFPPREWVHINPAGKKFADSAE